MRNLSIKNDGLLKTVQSQAIVRAAFGLPIIIIGGYLLARNGTGGIWVPLVGALIVFYIAFTTYCAFSGKLVGPQRLALATAVIDPLMESSWIPVMGEYGALVTGFYLFTIMGFGFRTGLKLMWICQISAIAGFSAIFFLGPFWQEYPVIWLSFLTMLIVVPGYASVLIKKLHEARAEAEHESQAKSHLLARVSHELRTPLTGIVAAAQLMLIESKNSNTGRRAESILGMAKELTAEIEDLLDQAKYESDALSLETEPVSIHELLERLKSTMEPAAARKGLRFDLVIDDSIVDWVITDSHYLGRVLFNLTGNAVKFTQSGHVRVETKLLDSSKTSYRIQFTVEDTGIGIAKEFHQRIFEPFYQVGGGTTRRFGGTGLGMAIAWEVVHTMGGVIKVDSQPGQGTRFQFDINFPRIDSPLQERASAEEHAAVLGKQILIVDDHETNVLLLKELLEQDQHKITTAMNAMDALTTLNAGEFDVAFFDYNLSDMDGAKLLQIYRFGKLKPAPVYFLTADATSITTSKLVNSGAAGVLHKPTSIQELRKAISKVCRNAPHQQTREPQETTSKPSVDLVKGDRRHIRPVPVQLLDTSRIERLRASSKRPGFLRELLQQAQSDIDLNCAELGDALRAGNAEAIRESAHALKGVCANIGAVRMAGLSSSLMGTRSEEVKQAVRLIDNLESLRAATSEAIEQVIAQLDAPDSTPDLSARLQ